MNQKLQVIKTATAAVFAFGLTSCLGCGDEASQQAAATNSYVQTSPVSLQTETVDIEDASDGLQDQSGTQQGTGQTGDAGKQDDQDAVASRATVDWDAPIEQPVEAKDMKKASPDADVWFDTEAKKIVMAGRVCQDAGALEFFATLRGYQEHEAVVTIKTKSSFVHALLLSMGINPGHPVQFRPEFKAAEGPEINVTVHWTDKEGKRQSAKAQDWIKNFETGKPLEHPFVFGGSTFVELNGGKEYYAADDGYLICVANFPSAMMDLPISSTDSNAGLLFEANTEKIPPIGTEVAVVLERAEKEKAADAKDGDTKDGDTKDGSVGE